MIKRASTSLSFHDDWTYDVFLNFRGRDTRYGFSGNLYYALNKNRIRTFFDGEKIRKGDEITPTLLKAIEKSRMAICVFSRNYASSTFCLDELVHIHQCIKGKGRLVWPVFYEMEPSEVRHQKGIYEQALVYHKIKNRADEKKMQSWKLALWEIANICGTHYNPRHGPYEYQLIEEIVKEISSIIKRPPLYVENRLLQGSLITRGELQMLRKRRLMEDTHNTSDCMSVDQGNNNINNGYKASIPVLPWSDHYAETKEEPSDLLQEIEYESKARTRDIQSARSRANAESVHVRRPEDKRVCCTQEVEALPNDDDHQVSRQDYIFDSNDNNNSLTWDPMECEYEGTSQSNNNKDPREQRRDHQWTRRLFCFSFLRF